MRPDIIARRQRVGGVARAAGFAAVYVAACGVMLRPICNFAALSTAVYEGDARLVAWALAWDNHATIERLPLFDANIFYPAHDALAYGEHFFGISLFSLPVYLATRNPVLGYNIVWILSYLLAAAAAHYVAWRLTRDHLASTVAGLSYAFCFFRMHHGHGHLHLLWSFWIPLSLVALERWVETASWRYLWAFVAIVVFQALSSWYQAVMVFVADALLMIWLTMIAPLLRRTGGPAAHRAALVLQGAVGGSAALLVVWLFARHYHVLASGGPAEAAPVSADLAGYFMPPENTIVGRWLLHHGVKGPRWIWGEVTIYVGWLTFTLASAGAAIAVRGGTAAARALRFFVLLGVAAVALSFGPTAGEVARNQWLWSPFGLLARIPGADLFRAPARFAELVTLALAVLAAGACAALHMRFGRAGRATTLALIPLLLLEFYVVDFPGGRPMPLPVPPVYRLIATLPAGPVVSLPDYALTALWFKEPDYQLFSTTHWNPIANGYSRGSPDGYRERIERLMTFPDSDALAAIREVGIRYVVVHAGDYPQGGGAADRAQREAGCRLLARFDDDYLFAIEP